MNRFDVSLFGIRINARGTLGIIGVSVVTAMVLAYLYLQMPAPLAGPLTACPAAQGTAASAIVDRPRSACWMAG